MGEATEITRSLSENVLERLAAILREFVPPERWEEAVERLAAL
jgi:hypothetical protein